jgi:hypothetical protein
MFADPLTKQLVDFVRGIGIAVRTESLEDTFLPGLDIRNGDLVIDPDRLAYPGDILHEAGHIAVADEPRRSAPRLKPTQGEEMAAMAWSFAAIRHLGQPAEVVFHAQGYKGNATTLAQSYAEGRGPGVPLLAWFGLTDDPYGPTPGDTPFPQMRRWLR